VKRNSGLKTMKSLGKAPLLHRKIAALADCNESDLIGSLSHFQAADA
jgi:hypothetical protein